MPPGEPSAGSAVEKPCVMGLEEGGGSGDWNGCSLDLAVG